MRQGLCGTSEGHRIADPETVYDSQDPSPHVEICDSCPSDTFLVPGTTSRCGCVAGFELHAPEPRDLGLENYGQECWSQCDEQQGPCSFCGTGLCCAYEFPDTSNGCHGSGIPGILNHHCAYPSITNTSLCQPCGAGKYSASIGDDPCVSCSAGKYSPGLGARACLDCG